MQELNKKLETFIEEHELQEYASRTLTQYRTAINKFIDFVGERDLDKKLMLEYKNYLDSISDSARSKNNWIIILNKFLKYIDRNDLLLKRIKTQNRYTLKRVLTITDYKRLLRFAKRNNYNQIYLVMVILAKTGIRISELKYFTVENLNRDNLQDGSLIIRNKGKERDISIRRDLIIEIRRYCRENKIRSGYIFPSVKNRNQMTCASTFWRQMKKVAGLARVNKSTVHAHSFRHLFAILFLKTYPGNTTQLADILGHNSIETTRIYTTLTSNQKRELLDHVDFKR